MTQPTEDSQQSVAALFDERQRYESWLAALEARRASTPPHIFERVHTDYAARLQRVIEQFQEHRSVVQGMADELTERLAALEREDAKQLDARMEAELRAAIGEFTAAECQECVRRTEEARSSIEEERSSVTAELSRLRVLLDPTAASIRTREHPAAASEEAAASPARQVPSREEASEPAVTAAQTSEEVERESKDEAAFDELEFLKSVVDEAVTNGADVPREQAPQQETSAQIATTASASASEETDTVRTGAGAGDASPDRATYDSSRGESEVGASRAPAPRESRSGTPAFLKGVNPEQVKTLRCQECQAMNYPTEWYCERCGAELATM
jgi:hypothetical protein